MSDVAAGETGEHHRVRHGIIFEPVVGYRAVREIDGHREFLGPWTSENRAQATTDEASRVWREVSAKHGAVLTDGDTPLGVWVPHPGGNARDDEQGR